jgi:hypothetical protein
VTLGTYYDEPFDVECQMKPVSNDYKTTGEKVTECILNWKGTFLDIEDGL